MYKKNFILILKQIIRNLFPVKKEEHAISLSISENLKILFHQKGTAINIESIEASPLLSDIKLWKRGYALQYYCRNNDSQLILIAQKEVKANSLPHWQSLFLLEQNSSSNEYQLPFSLEVPFYFSEENRRDIFYRADSSHILKIIDQKSKSAIYLLINKTRYEEVRNLIKTSWQFQKAVKELVLNDKQTATDQQSIHLNVSESEDFSVSSLFIPNQIIDRPSPINTRLQSISLDSTGNSIIPWSGVSYKVILQIDDTPFELYYLFNHINKELFAKFMKKVLKKISLQFQKIGLPFQKVQCRNGVLPSAEFISEAIELDYYITSTSKIAHGHIYVPMGLVSFLLAKIAPPWSIVFTLDSPVNRLKSFLALNREIRSQGLLNFIAQPKSSIDLSHKNPLKKLRHDFLKVHHLIDFVSPEEGKKLLFDYFYRQGWSGRKLKRLFYYNITNPYSGKPIRLLPLEDFNEVGFTQLLVKNMDDEWIHSSNSGFKPKGDLLLEHFSVLRDLYENKTYKKSFKMQSLLDDAFSRYYAEVDSLFDFLKSDLSYADLKPWHLQHLKSLFNNNHKVKKMFYYTPDHLSHFSDVLGPGRLEDLERMEMDPPARLDDWMDGVFHFRSCIRNIIKNTQKDYQHI